MNNPLLNMAMLTQLRSNPMALLQRAGLNIPPNMNNPQAIIQHLMNSGQLTQGQMNQAQELARQMGVKM